MHRLHHRLASAAVLVLAANCSEPVTPGPTRGVRVALAPQFSRADASIFRSLSTFALDVDNVHIMVFRPRTETVLTDTVVAFPATSDQIAVQLTLQLEADEETLSASLELRSATTVMFTGNQSLTVRQGLNSEPASIPVTYIGPGYSAQTLQLDQRSPTVDVGARLSLVATAFDATGYPVPDLPLSWSSTNAAVATVDDKGTVSGVTVGTASVVVHGLNGLADTATVTVIPPPGPASELRPAVDNPLVIDCCQGTLVTVAVHTTDAYGHLVPPPSTLTVTFTVGDTAVGGFGANFLPSATVRTDATGLASTQFAFKFGSPSSSATVTASATIGTTAVSTKVNLSLLSAGNRIPASTGALSTSAWPGGRAPARRSPP